MNSLPLVSVIVLSYRRAGALERCLSRALDQDYPRCEVIVADNHSDDPAVERVLAARAARITLVRLPENGGACAGRNAGIRAARGDILVTLDDDVILETSHEISALVEAFSAHPEADVLTFLVRDEAGRVREREWCHPRPWKQHADAYFETDYIAEGAAAFRREVFTIAGLYYERLFIGCEGVDLALRILDHRFTIAYTPRVRVQHLMSAETRARERACRLYTRNYIWIAYKDYPPLSGAAYLVPKLAMMLYFAVRTQALGAFFAGLWNGIAGLPRLRRSRTVIGRDTRRRIAEMERWRPAWTVRLARHREQPQI